MRDQRKTHGLYKLCQHQSWDTCRCPWWAQYRGVRVSLKRWALGPTATRKKATAALQRLRGAVDAGTFNHTREGSLPTGDVPFADFLDRFYGEHVVANRLKSSSPKHYIALLKRGLGNHTMAQLAANPFIVERWLSQAAEKRNWRNGTYNKYRDFGRAVFNVARRWRIVRENPFADVPARRGADSRLTRLPPDLEQRLIAACEQLDRHRWSSKGLNFELAESIHRRVDAGERQYEIAVELGLSRALVSEIVAGKVWSRPDAPGPRTALMRRRIAAAVHLGLRAGEMLAVQVKHVDFENWILHLPQTKSGKPQIVYIESPQMKAIFNERRALGLDAFVFGYESGARQRSFKWQRLFKLAGIKTGRYDGLVWHDMRHEYGSYLIEQHATIQEVRQMMRHADITTTARYLAARPERLRELARTFAHRYEGETR